MISTLPSYILAFCRVVICLTFLYSFVGKMKNISSFEQAIKQFNIVPHYTNRGIALLILGGELAIVFLVTFGGALLIWGFILSVILLFSFNVAMSIVLIEKAATSCNCFGTNTRPISIFDIGRNTGFIFCALLGVGLQIVADAGTVDLSFLEWGIIGLIAITFVTGWVQVGEIVQVFRS